MVIVLLVTEKSIFLVRIFLFSERMLIPINILKSISLVKTLKSVDMF